MNASPASGVVDAHVHLYPAEVAADPVGWAAGMREPLWGALVAPHPERRVRQGWADLDRLLRDMDAAGIERSVLLGWYWERLETCIWQNRFYAECVRRHPDRLSAFATIAPQDGANARAELRRAADEGLVGLGEICPRALGQSPLAPEWLELFTVAEELRWPVNLHVTDPAARHFPGRVETPLSEIVALARERPGLRLILAHWGGGLVLHELSAHCRRALRHCFYDTAASPLLYDRRIHRLAVEIAGPERVLFGSDYPLLVFAPDQTEPGFGRVLAEMERAGLEPEARAAILGGNARRLLSARAPVG